MKSILLYVHEDAGAEARLQAAFDIARATGGHIRCVQPIISPAFLSADLYGGAYYDPEILAELVAIDERTRARTEDRLRAEGVTWDWRQVQGEPVRGLLSAAALADLIVVSLAEGAGAKLTDPPPIAGDLALGGQGPVLAVPQQVRSVAIVGRALVAWDGSQEASAALRAAIPLLKLAQEVHVITVEEDGKSGFPATDAPEYLAWHGIQSELHDWPRAGRSVADALAAVVGELRPDWMVMGAFGHNRMREFIFGGVTRTMLREASIPVLLAH